jgi:hypothetical protein
MLSLGPDDPLIQFITNPVLGFVVTLVTSAAVAFSVRRWPNDKSFWQDVFDWPGKVIVGVSLTTGLVGALPRLVWEPGEFRCNAAGCWVEGGGDQVIEGTGLGAFVVQTLLSMLADLPVAGAGLLVGLGLAKLFVPAAPARKGL